MRRNSSWKTFEATRPLIPASSSSRVKRARNVTFAGPNLTTSDASYEPSSCCSPSCAPGTHSTTTLGSDSRSHTARGADGTSIRSLTSIMLESGCAG
ncbi:hypothetical protein D3C83_30070 [compost metagenome]